MVDNAGNLQSMPAVFPDYSAPIIRTGPSGVRELVRARWGMPSPDIALIGKSGKKRQVDKGVTNIRNTASPHWRRWLEPGSRCLVPFNSFSENITLPDGRSEPIWFALNASRPLAFFAGIWTGWTCTRKLAEGEITCDVFAFLTTMANAEVFAIHPKAMPVILTKPDEIETWMTSPWVKASTLQRPLANGTLRIVARGEKQDQQND